MKSLCSIVLLIALSLSYISAESVRPTFKSKPSAVPTPDAPLVVYNYFDGTTRIHYEIVHAPVFLLDSADHILSVQCQGAVIRIETSPNYQLVIPVNTTLIGSAEWKCADDTGRTGTPMYRKLLSLSAPWKDGNKYYYTAQTAYASVADCFEDGSFMNISSTAMNTPFTGNLSSSDSSAAVTKDFGWNYDTKTGKAEKSIELWSAGSSHVDCSNCWVDFEFGVSVGVSFGRKDIIIPYLKAFHADVFGSARLNTEITAASSGAAKSNGNKVMTTIPLPGFTFFIGLVPVYIGFSIPISVGYTFAATAAASFVTGYDIDGSVGMGIEYNGQWVPSANKDFTATYHKPTVTKLVEASSTAYIGASINMEFYAVGGGQFNIQRGLVANMTLPGGCPNPQAHIAATYGLTGTIDAMLTKPIHVESPSITVFKSAEPLADKCF